MQRLSGLLLGQCLSATSKLSIIYPIVKSLKSTRCSCRTTSFKTPKELMKRLKALDSITAAVKKTTLELCKGPYFSILSSNDKTNLIPVLMRIMTSYKTRPLIVAPESCTWTTSVISLKKKAAVVCFCLVEEASVMDAVENLSFGGNCLKREESKTGLS